MVETANKIKKERVVTFSLVQRYFHSHLSFSSLSFTTIYLFPRYGNTLTASQVLQTFDYDSRLSSASAYNIYLLRNKLHQVN